MTTLGLTVEQWTEIGISVLIVFAAITVGRWILRLIIDRGVARIVGRTDTDLDNSILEVARPLFYLLLLLVALQIAITRISFLPDTWRDSLPNAFFILYFAAGFAMMFRLVDVLVDWYSRQLEEQAAERSQKKWLPFLRRVVIAILIAIGLVTILGRFGVDISALVATLGVGSLAIALAAQASLSDLISGVIIMIDQPYRIGDRIEILDLDTWGDVEDVGMRSTRVRTRDNRMVIVPNSVIGKSLVVNHSYPNSEYRIQIHLSLAYGTDLDLARDTMVDAVSEVEGVLKDRRVEALFLEFGDDGLVFRVRWWLGSYEDTRRMFDRVNSAIYAALEREGIELGAPDLNLYHFVDRKTVVETMEAIKSVR